MYVVKQWKRVAVVVVRVNEFVRRMSS